MLLPFFLCHSRGNEVPCGNLFNVRHKTTTNEKGLPFVTSDSLVSPPYMSFPRTRESLQCETQNHNQRKRFTLCPRRHGGYWLSILNFFFIRFTPALAELLIMGVTNTTNWLWERLKFLEAKKENRGEPWAALGGALL